MSGIKNGLSNIDDLIVCLFFVIIFINLSTFGKSGAKFDNKKVYFCSTFSKSRKN
jgi:hypothetical protein